NGPVKYLLTAEEARTYSRIGGDAERAEVVARFWGGGDPPSPAGGKLRGEVGRGAAVAGGAPAGGADRGSLDERGMGVDPSGPRRRRQSSSGRSRLPRIRRRC